MACSFSRLIMCVLFLLPSLVGCAKPIEISTQLPSPAHTKMPSAPTLEPTPTIKPGREPVSAVEVEGFSSAFINIINLHAEAWNKYDLDTLRLLYSDNIEFTDASFGDHMIGIDNVMEMARGMSEDYSSMRRKVIDHFIGRYDGIATYDYWGVFEFTPDQPFFTAFKYKIQDNRITNWTLYEGLDAAEKLKLGDKLRFDEARSLLSNYQLAWSSGDSKVVADLYATDSVRTDTIFEEKQEGREAIISFAESLFAWYPGVRWTQLQSFGEWKGISPITGGIFSIKVTDTTNKPCEILVAVLLQASGGKIMHEDLYYQPDSLIQCGWAK